MNAVAILKSFIALLKTVINFSRRFYFSVSYVMILLL